MPMLLKSLAKIFLLALPLTVNAAGTSQSAAQVLEQYLPSDCYHTGQYRQAKSVQGLAAPLITTGSFVFDCNNGLIWHTQTPIVETLVYTEQGAHTHIKEHGALSDVDGRVQRALGTILNNLIAGDTEFILKNFELSALANGFVLTPKARRMKKFLNKIELQEVPTGQHVELTLFHPHQELTQISITEKRVLTSLDQSKCDALGTVPPAACSTLLQK